MLHDHQKLMSVFALAGEITGRKKLQKMVFIAKKMKFPFQEKFEFHFYGPYSEELTLRVEELCNFGFIEEVKEDKGGYSQYRYAITSSGHEFFESEPMDIPQLKECLNDMNGQSSRFLELVSTILYFEDLPKEEVVEKVADLKRKQNYSIEEIDEAYEYIETLKKTAYSH
ncbi:YwgA family protein [Siminovitchia acidinfaciens]|uniref:YwgA family protein n=1 Tax=Siminovitchia acidinfaciens TaxID=2321395 RepID=A0A429Y6G6_9BACI|nr:YwgA family protein [Siminovitchia acidinfaciens]RST77031.1 YwgA family protein [Siminovitchia acidinfaciens]